MERVEQMAFSAGKDAFHAGAELLNALASFAPQTLTAFRHFLLGYCAAQFPKMPPPDYASVRGELSIFLDEFFRINNADFYRTDASRFAEAFSKGLTKAASELFDDYFVALLRYLDDLTRGIFFQGMKTGIRCRTQAQELWGILGLDYLHKLPHMIENVNALDAARAALCKKLRKAKAEELHHSEPALVYAIYLQLPRWFMTGYSCGVDFGSRYILHYRENQKLTATLMELFYQAPLS